MMADDCDRDAIAKKNVLTGAEPFLIGICPNYWAHVPMTVAAVQRLHLVDGIHCWTSGSQYVPVSKCVLVGCIVNVCIRSSDESILYVLDDGSGVIDCLAWTKESECDIFHLPSLTNDTPVGNEINLGDKVRIFGKINCLAIREDGVPVREIHASMVEKVEQIGSTNVETRHWQKCAERELDLIRDPTRFNSLKWMDLLGSKIADQIKQRHHLPAADDAHGEWRVFGASCRCRLSYKAELLYCHCTAKVESLDPHFVFRDALLAHLLKVQAELASQLVFPFRGIKINPELQQKAVEVVSKYSKNDQDSSVLNIVAGRLLHNTFRALRHDGILYLVDVDKDNYLFVTRRWVLEPYVRRKTKISKENGSKNFIDLQDAHYLSPIHRDRLLFIKRCIGSERQADES